MASTLPPEILSRSLAAVARESGVTAELAERLEKAERRPSPEPFMRGLEASLAGRLAAHTRIGGDAVSRWCEHCLIEPLRRGEISPDHTRGSDDLQKAQAGLGLTAAQIDELRRLIEAHFHVPVGEHPVEWTIPQAQWERWRAAGITIEGFQIPEIQDAWTAGRLYQVIEEGATFEEMKRLAARPVMSRAAQLAFRWAEHSAARAITGAGVRLGALAAARSMTAHRRLVRGLIERYLRGELPRTAPARGPAHDLTPQERRGLETGQLVESWRQLATELRRQFGASDADRDWARVAATETRLAHNIGRVQSMAEQRVQHVIYRVWPDACRGCRTLYLDPDGTPRIFRVGYLLDQLAETGGSNIGRKLSKLGDPDEGWVVTGGVVHPWCRCRPVPYMGKVPWERAGAVP